MKSVSRRTFLGASAAALCFTRLARAATPFTRQPYLQRLLLDRVSILWTTAQPSSGSVSIVAPNGSLTSFAAAITAFQPATTELTAAYYQYQADVTGLEAGTQYQYQVQIDGVTVAADPVHNSFRTPTTGNFSFLVFGDSGADSSQQISLVGLMAAETGISKVVHVGDLAYDSGTFAQFDANYFAINAPLMGRLPFFTTAGNHEYETNSAAPYLAVHAMPVAPVPVPATVTGRYYSFDWGDAHFVSVDSNLLPTADAAAMLAWLDADLAASQKYWKIVFLHHPPYPTGTHLDDPICALVQQNVNPIVEKHGVPLVLSGHEHGYERTFPLVGGQPVNASQPSTTYVITGGGGAAMENVGTLPQTALSLQAFNYLRVDVSATKLTFTAKGLNGNVIDSVTLNPPPVLAANGVVNAGDFSTAIAPGSLVSLFGQNLAIRPVSAPTLPLPSQLAGVSVSANGVPAPVLYASPTQVNVQMPFEVSGQVTLQVTTPNGSASTKVNVVPTAPSILAVVVGDELNSSSNPAVPGGYVTLYLTGLGATASAIATGQAAPAAAVPVAAAVQVKVANSLLQPLYAGLAPGFAGVDQVNFELPPGLGSGVFSIQVVAGGATSGAVPLTVGAVKTGSPGAGGGALGTTPGGNAAQKVRSSLTRTAAAGH
jgi:uncharacterized protein (TIGR03437 family)